MNILPSQLPPNKEVDVAFLVFIERYATNLLKWDILSFFAKCPDFCVSASTVAEEIGRSVHSVWPELGDLVLLGILTQCDQNEEQPLYQLTKSADLRKMALKLANQPTRVNTG